jgi:glyoxylase-like metal-dependent hydrolase (beta-lactamase superfamily II)
MIVECLVVGLVQTNCYVIADEKTGHTAVIDPGGDVEQIVSILQEIDTRFEADLRVDTVIDTHAHFDHVQDNGRLLEALARVQPSPPKLVAHAQAVSLLSIGGGAELFGLRAVPSPEPDVLVKDGDVLSWGSVSFQVLHTPGHSQGSISLYSAEEACVFVGDVLFAQGVGRTDLPGGNWKTLLNSIRDRLFALPDDTVVYPGHGPATTIGREKRSNPFL